ncbi:hypothetical protein [Pelagibacterium luteolum]|uniref:Uncharacterized protein n=1 Tax=Pelagibacterium luteolum TaxID=440168 RepID=A0A1G7ZIX7_9HYPH|nr:hypothetical protein [Pelagibacterium luteolum]SDH08050.1 hypothetical protein SAMN04487974_12016 [Pelagibacterium luteolum]
MSASTINIYDRIADHSAAMARFDRAITLADEMAAEEEGRTVTDEQREEHEAADEHENATLYALLAHTPANCGEMRRKIGYLRMHMQTSECLDREQLFLLLDSFDAYRA